MVRHDGNMHSTESRYTWPYRREALEGFSRSQYGEYKPPSRLRQAVGLAMYYLFYPLVFAIKKSQGIE